MAKGKKTGGRKRGTPNKNSRELREILSAKGVNVPEMLLDLMDDVEMPVTKKADILLGLMPYLHPKLASLTHAFDPKELSDSELLEEAKRALEHFEASQDGEGSE
jgi:hypothetical protein